MSPDPHVSTARVIDLFAGVGGLSEGFRRSSFTPGKDVFYRTLYAVEIDRRAAAGYAENHPESNVFSGPIQEWTPSLATVDADVVIGGPPCQGFSALGKRRLDDERNFLWREYARVVSKVAPKYFIMENVPQFRTSPQFELFKSMTQPGGPLSEYSFSASILNAANYGAPQVRKRVIILGYHRDLGDPGMPQPTHAPIDPHASHCSRSELDRNGPTNNLAPWVTVRDVIGDVGPLQELPEERVIDIGGRLSPGPYRLDELHVGRNYTKLSRERFAAIPPGGNRFNLPDELKCAAWIKHSKGSTDVMGRLFWDRPSVTIRTEFTKPEKGRYIHPVEDRAITPLEGGLLQGFPPHYRFIGSMTDIVRQIGNAVPIPLGAAIGRHIAQAL